MSIIKYNWDLSKALIFQNNYRPERHFLEDLTSVNYLSGVMTPSIGFSMWGFSQYILEIE